MVVFGRFAMKKAKVMECEYQSFDINIPMLDENH